ncbi:hypothetical protein BH24ACI5_BH24ACI5_17760 [soil metagenome]
MASCQFVRSAIVVLVAVGSAPLRADEPRAPVPVPLVITDARGASIRNLNPADLEITENGESRRISSLAFHGPEPRRITILLDDYHIEPGPNTERVRSAVAAFIDRHVRPNDTLRVVRPPGHFDAASDDAAQAREAVRRFAGRKGEYTPQGAFEVEYMGVAPAFASRQRAQIVRAALESVATAMRGSEGAKALIVVTEGFAQGEPTRARTTTLRTIARAARLANVPVYILDPSSERPADSPLNDAWRSIAVQTGGVLFEAGSSLEASLARIATELEARYVLEFEPSAREDGSFHGIEVRVKRKGAVVRAPSGYWAAFPASRFASPVTRSAAHMRTPHASGLIQPWFRMAPGSSGRTRVTFAWMPRPAGNRAAQVSLEVVTFEGVTLHASTVAPLPSSGAVLPVETTFEAPPGPVQISMAIATDANTLLDTDVRYIDVRRLDTARPVIAAIEFVRPRSLPEFTALQLDPHALPTEVRDFLRQDRLLVRVRAFALSGAPEVQVRLVNRLGHTLLLLPVLPVVGDATQFDLPFARYPRGEYRLEVKVNAGGETVTQLLPVRLIG